MKWIKPNGTEIETRDTVEVVAFCKSLGWTDAEAKPRGRPRKQVIDSLDVPSDAEDE